MQTKTASLYINNNGMTCCIDHGGSYLRSEYAHKPERNTYTTPLDSWERIDDGYVAEWTAIVGCAPKCEICRD
jgi:hypothetical protein